MHDEMMTNTCLNVVGSVAVDVTHFSRSWRIKLFPLLFTNAIFAVNNFEQTNVAIAF